MANQSDSDESEIERLGESESRPRHKVRRYVPQRKAAFKAQANLKDKENEELNDSLDDSDADSDW